MRERYTGKRLVYKKAMSAVRAYEFELSRALLTALGQVPGLRVYGLTDPYKLDLRVPTFSFRIGDQHPLDVAKALAAENIYAWEGNYYALEVTTRLGLEKSGGMVRVGAVHYNTVEEVMRLGEVLKKIAK